MELLIILILLCFCVVFPIVAFWGGGTTAKERNAARKLKLQETFSSLPIGTTFLVAANRFRQCEAISSPNLVSEVTLENGVNRKVYIWYLDWEYVVSKSSGVGVMPMVGSYMNPSGAGLTFANGTAASFTNSQTTQNAFIQMVFDNDKLVAKEQQGLFQDMIIK